MFFQIGSQLPHQEKGKLIEFLRKNIDVFAWNAYEAPRVDPEFICHHLKVNPLITPRKQPPRRPSKELAEAMWKEVAKLKQAKAIKKAIKDLCKPTETSKETARIHQIRVGPSWMDSIIQFLEEDTMPEERVEADKVRRKATRFWLSEN